MLRGNASVSIYNSFEKLFCKVEQRNEARNRIMRTRNFFNMGLYIVFDINDNNAVEKKRITLKKRWGGEK